MGALRGFVGEIVASDEEVTVSEAAASRVDDTEDVKQIERRRAYFESKADAVTISGAPTVMKSIVRHPANNKPIAIVAVKWSGASLKAATDLKHSMQKAQEVLDKRVDEAKKSKVKGRIILQRSNVNKNDL